MTNLDFEEIYYYRTFFINSSGTYYGNEISFNIDTTNAVYLDTNGITIKAYDWAKVGASGNVNEISYIVVDEAALRHSISNNKYNVCVSKVQNMSGLFSKNTTFNQDINNWDVSNATDMSFMFGRANYFNQDLSSWDVSGVIDMRSMFAGASAFNKDISSWNVSNVTVCRGFSTNVRNWFLPKPNFTNCTP